MYFSRALAPIPAQSATVTLTMLLYPAFIWAGHVPHFNLSFYLFWLAVTLLTVMAFAAERRFGWAWVALAALLTQGSVPLIVSVG